MKSTSSRNKFPFGRTLLCSLLIFVFTLPAAAQSTQSATFTTFNYPFLGTFTAVDLNGDGRLDLAGASADTAAVMLNNGNGTFQPQVIYPVAGGTQAVAAGDFNSDGRADVVVTIATPQVSLALLTGNGDGTLNAAVHFPNTSGFDSPDLVATDLNNDGRLDLAILHSIACFTAPCVAAEVITVMLGNGDGTFQSRELPAPQHMHALETGDFNRDGIKDLAIGSENTKLHILLGVGDGTFARQPEMTLVPGGDLFSACNDVDVADFNRDSIQDLVIPLGNGNGNVILLGNGDGTFRQSFRITERATSAPLNLAVADFNLDGLPDIARAMADGTTGLLEIANGNGDGTFQPPVRYLQPPSQSSLGAIYVMASDFNGDNKPDVTLRVGGASAFLNVLINSTGGGTAPPTQTPPAPTLLSPANNAQLPRSQPIPFSWSAVPGAATYEIQFDDSSSFTNPLIAAQTGLTQTQTTQTFTSERRFWWRVRARSAGGINSAWSSVRSFEIRRNAAPLPTFTRTPTAIGPSLTPTSTMPPPTTGPSATPTLTLPPTATRTATTIPSPTNTRTPTTVAADTISIQVAEYSSGNRQLRVEATGSNSSATLSVYVTSTNTLIGTLRNEGGGRYRGDFSWSTNPQNITVRSSLGGQATRTVTLK